MSAESSLTPRIALLSCYELGHVPLGLAGPVGVLQAEGFPVYAADTAVCAPDEDIIATSCLVAISAPMHTALRLAVRLARHVRSVNPAAHIVFYGLYAELNREGLREFADSCLGAEFERDLVRLAHAVFRRPTGVLPRNVRFVPTAAARTSVEARRTRRLNRATVLSAAPDRLAVPRHSGHVQFTDGTRTVPAASTATTRGCRYLCRHCPLPAAYRGTFYALPIPGVLTDIDALVAGGAGHITFADPDFLNTPRRALIIARAMHKAHPEITFDYTARIDHLQRFSSTVDELQNCGNQFVVSAIESFSNVVLERLHKGHTRADALSVIRSFRRRSLALRPSFVPFTPWETRAGLREIVNVIDGEGLINAVDPVQYGLRLLLPPGSLLLDLPDMQRQLRGFDTERFTWRWVHPDPEMDELQVHIADCTARDADAGAPIPATFARICELIRGKRATSRKYARAPGITSFCGHATADGNVPRLTESWFC